MSVNQIIVLLDCYRGLDVTRHPGTFNSDKKVLIGKGLIDSDCITTEKGENFVRGIKFLGASV